MADPLPYFEAPPLRTRNGVRAAGALAVVLIHALLLAAIRRCDEPAKDALSAPPTLRVALHGAPVDPRPPRDLAISPAAPALDLVLPELHVQAAPVPESNPAPAAAVAAPDRDASSPGVPAPPRTAPARAAAARDCWPFRWLLRLSRTIDSALRHPAHARRRGERGTALLRMSVERGGQVLDAVLVRSSGHPQLDAEARAVVARIGRFEPLSPGECPGYDVIVVDQPVRFGP